MAFSDKMKSKTKVGPFANAKTVDVKPALETPEEEAGESPEMQAQEENTILGALQSILKARTMEECKALAQEAIAMHGKQDQGEG